MSDPLWSSAEIAAATGGVASDDFHVSGLSIDTRSLQLGDLFVALKDVRDGHDFVETAFEAGATGALVSRDMTDRPVVRVDDVLSALEALGLASRDRAANCYRVAVTGSVGKTSVKEMLAQIFRAHGAAHCNVKSFNNHWGVPLTLARMPRETQRAVFEIGMSTPGEIAPRSKMVEPHCALITKIAPAHLEGVGSIEGVAEEKAGIFAGLQPGGLAIIPHEDEFAPLLKARAKAQQPDCRILTFGMSREADAYVHQVYSDGQTMSVYVMVHGHEVCAEINAIGDHWALNVAAALLVACQSDGVDAQTAAEALSGYSPPPGRGTAEMLRLPQGGAVTLIDDAYNANPESMRAALKSMTDRPAKGTRIAVLGEMLEVGATSAAEHAALAEPIHSAGVTQVYLAGDGMVPLVETLSAKSAERTESIWSVKAEGFENDLKNALKDGDLLLLKGSNASGINRLADRLRQWSASADEQVMDSGVENTARGRDAV